MRDMFDRCAVCGRRPSEDCCAFCHRAHDYVEDYPLWALSGNGNEIIPAQRLQHSRSHP